MHICTNIFYFLLLALDNTKGTLVVREEVDKPGSLFSINNCVIWGKFQNFKASVCCCSDSKLCL